MNKICSCHELLLTKKYRTYIWENDDIKDIKKKLYKQHVGDLLVYFVKKCTSMTINLKLIVILKIQNEQSSIL